MEFKQLLGAGLGSTVGLNLQCSHPAETKGSVYAAIKEMLSIQHKLSCWVDKIFFLCVWMDLTMILDSPNFGAVDTVNQEHSAMKESLMLGSPKICEWCRLGSMRVSQLCAIGQTQTKPETPGRTRPWWNNGHGRMTQTRSHAQNHGGSTNDSPVQVSPKEQIKIGTQS